MTVDSPFTMLNQTMPDYRMRVEFWAIFGCFIFLAAVVELVRRKRLKEKYSLLWFLTSGVLLFLTLRRSWLEDVAQVLGVYYPPTALFLILVFFMLLILLHYSTVISELLNDKQTLTQELGILERRLKDLEKTVKDQV